MTEQYYQFRNIIELSGFCLHNTFLFKTSSMSRLRVWQWDHQLVPLLAICIWNVLREKPLHLLPTPLGFGRGLWMTHGSSKNRLINKAFLEHINSIDPAIKFTVEETQGNGAILPSLTPLSYP